MKKHSAFTLVELLVVVLIVAIMMAGGFMVFSTGESSWFTAGAAIEIQENLRKVLDNVIMELRESRYALMAISDNTGIGGSDEVQFQIPVICHAGDILLDSAGDIAHWGATLRRGCREASCMDADDSCASVEYKYIRYKLVSGNRLVREVVAPDFSVVRQDIMAVNVTDFQVIPVNVVNPTVLIAVQATVQVPTVLKRNLSTTVSTNLYVRN